MMHLPSENDAQRASAKRYYLRNVEIKDYNIMNDGKNFFNQPIKNKKTKIATGQGNDYTTGCLLDYPYFKDSYKTTAVDSSKQQVLVADPIAIQQINSTAISDRAGNKRIFFILEEAKEIILDFHKEL